LSFGNGFNGTSSYKHRFRTSQHQALSFEQGLCISFPFQELFAEARSLLSLGQVHLEDDLGESSGVVSSTFGLSAFSTGAATDSASGVGSTV